MFSLLCVCVRCLKDRGDVYSKVMVFEEREVGVLYVTLLTPTLPRLHPSITKQRTEVVFEGTHHKNPESPSAVWEEYEFKCKPGKVDRTPCLISPYHYRLDWLMWFAAFQVCVCALPA